MDQTMRFEETLRRLAMIDEGFVEDQPLRRVVVRVDDDRAVVQLLRARGDRMCRCLRKDDNGSR